MSVPPSRLLWVPLTSLESLRSLARRHVAALALTPGEANQDLPQVGRGATVLVLAIHLAGLAAFWRYYHQPVWLALPLLALLLAAPLLAMLIPRVRRSTVQSAGLAVETLAPLFLLYLILLARVVAVRVLLANEPYQDEASFADPRFVFFQVEATVAAVAGYLAIVQVQVLASGALRTRLQVALAAVLLAGALGWFAAETVGHRTRGVTATDPYAYAQMAVDLATRGTALHVYPLFPAVANLGVSWYPVEHIGYRLFDNLSGAVPSVWPFGGSIWLAVAYKLIGEDGLYLATPLAALAALAALAFLAREYARDQSTGQRAAFVAVCVALLATSWEQVDRSIVPLVDAQAQLFSVLAILFALMGARTAAAHDVGVTQEHRAAVPFAPNARGIFAVLAGLALGAAYLVRHTQLLMAIPLLAATLPLTWRSRLRFLVAIAVPAFVVAAPDLWYHHLHLGGVFVPESHELVLFSWSSVVPSLVALNQRFSAGNEFGYLVPLLLYGLYRSFRDQGWKAAVLLVWVLALGGFHLLYAAVKIRDLLPEYPAVIVWTAYGMVALARDLRAWAGQVGWRQLVAGVAVFVILLLPAMRDRLTILRPLQPVKVTFGYVTAEQRAAFDRIAALTAPNAVVGSTMNDGAIDLYAQRATFRPGAWDSNERRAFMAAMERSNRPVYILDDGAETSAARRDLEAQYVLRRIAVLDVPLFGDVDGTPGALWQIVGTVTN